VIVFPIEPGWVKQPWLRNEWSTALEAAWKVPPKRLIPVLIEDAKAPAFLRSNIAIRVGKRQKKLEPVVQSIVTALRADGPLTDRAAEAREEARRQKRLREIRAEVEALRG